MRTPCAACRGAGVRAKGKTQTTCPHCDGRGYYFDRRCPRCGELRERESASICDACSRRVAENVGQWKMGKRGPSH